VPRRRPASLGQRAVGGLVILCIWCRGRDGECQVSTTTTHATRYHCNMHNALNVMPTGVVEARSAETTQRRHLARHVSGTGMHKVFPAARCLGSTRLRYARRVPLDMTMGVQIGGRQAGLSLPDAIGKRAGAGPCHPICPDPDSWRYNSRGCVQPSRCHFLLSLLVCVKSHALFLLPAAAIPKRGTGR
jgi:hypothetical protein